MRALEVKDVVKTYGGFRALGGVSLAVEKGEIRALIGPNGAGKSTLIDVISGRARNWTGKVELLGEDVSGLDPRRLRLRGLARSFQKTSIFPRLTVRQQLLLAAERVGQRDVGELLTEFALDDVADRPARSIGYGDQRRLDLA